MDVSTLRSYFKFEIENNGCTKVYFLCGLRVAHEKKQKWGSKKDFFSGNWNNICGIHVFHLLKLYEQGV